MAPIRQFKPKIKRKKGEENGGSRGGYADEFISLALVDIKLSQAKQRKEGNNEGYKR